MVDQDDHAPTRDGKHPTVQTSVHTHIHRQPIKCSLLFNTQAGQDQAGPLTTTIHTPQSNPTFGSGRTTPHTCPKQDTDTRPDPLKPTHRTQRTSSSNRWTVVKRTGRENPKQAHPSCIGPHTKTTHRQTHTHRCMKG